MSKDPKLDDSVVLAEAAVLAARADLAATVDALAGRLDPRARAAEASAAARTAMSDAQGLLSGKGLPTSDPARTRNVALLAGAALGVVALVALVVVRRR